METKQTAVEWLYDTLIIFPESIDDLAHNARSFQQAKAMEKEQIKSDFHNSLVAMAMGKIMSPEQYYNETYKQQDN